jgi:hypothetical protein
VASAGAGAGSAGGSGAVAARYVQLGAYSTRSRAESAWKALSAQFPHELKALQPRYVPGKIHARSIVRLQVGVSSRAMAKGVCSKLRKHAQSCVSVSA